MAKLKVGDEVMWRGGFGRDAAQKAKITAIEVNCQGKYGTHVSEVEWKKVNTRTVLVDLDNGHWAYGTQINPIR